MNNKIYYVNKGYLQDFSQNNNNKHFNKLDWDSDYNGNVANIAIKCNDNGNKKQYGFRLNNTQLENLFTIPSVEDDLFNRIQYDYNRPKMIIPEPKMYQLVLPEEESSDTESIENIFQNMNEPASYLPTPASNEELIVPISIDDKTLNQYTLSPNKRHMRKKTHKTYRVYKKPKSKSRSSRSKSHKTSSKSKRRTKTLDYTIF